MLDFLKSEVFIWGGGGRGRETRPPLSEFSRTAPVLCNFLKMFELKLRTLGCTLTASFPSNGQVGI